MASIWSYHDAPRGYRSFHYRGAHTSLSDAISKYQTYGKATIPLTPPSAEDISISGCTNKIDHWYRKCQLIPGSERHIAASGDRLELSLNDDGTIRLSQAFQAYEAGENDFCVFLGEIPLWFW